MARVSVNQGLGALRDRFGPTRPGVEVYVYSGDNLAVGYTTPTGTTQVSYPLVTNPEGQIDGAFYAPGTYTITVPGDDVNPSMQWDAISGVDLSGVLPSLAVVKEAPVNVKYPEFGAVGDGSTNDSAAINAAIVAANGKGQVFLPGGIYRANITARPKMSLRGENGRGAILKSVSGSGADVIRGLNFSTLTTKMKATGDHALGAPEVTLESLIIDGDKANNSAGCGVRIWGRAPTLKSVDIRNCKDHGLYTEFTDIDSFGDPVQVIEGYFEDIKTHGNGKTGWIHRGPHDSVALGYTTYSNGEWGHRAEQFPAPADYSGGDPLGYNGGITHYVANSFLNANSFYAGGSLFVMIGGAITGTTGTGLEMAAASGGTLISDVVVAGHQIGVLARGANHMIDARFARMTQHAIKLDGVGWSSFFATGDSNSNVMNVASEVGPNMVRGIFNIPSGKTLKTGSAWNSRSIVQLAGNGAGGDFIDRGSRLGFFDTAAISKPAVSGAKGGNAALTSLISQLAALGLVTDSTT